MSDNALDAVRYLCLTAVTIGLIVGSVLEHRRKP